MKLVIYELKTNEQIAEYYAETKEECDRLANEWCLLECEDYGHYYEQYPKGVFTMKKALWTCGDGTEYTLLFDEEGKWTGEAIEELPDWMQYEPIPSWEEFDVKWED